MGGEDFDMSDPCDVLKLEELKAKMCFVSEDIDRENNKMGKEKRKWNSNKNMNRFKMFKIFRYLFEFDVF